MKQLTAAMLIALLLCSCSRVVYIGKGNTVVEKRVYPGSSKASYSIPEQYSIILKHDDGSTTEAFVTRETFDQIVIGMRGI